MPIPVIAQIALGVALSIAAYLLMPKPKPPRAPSVEDLNDPTAEAGRPIPVVFGSTMISGLNNIWYGDKKISKREVDIDK